MSGRLSEQDREVLSRIVADLLPAAHGMPEGNAVGIARGGVDAVLKLRPDLAPDLLRAIRIGADGGDLAALQSDLEAWHALRMVTYGAYYTAPEVQAALNYSGQTSQPIDPDETPEWLAKGLLDPVIARGPIWTPAPD